MAAFGVPDDASELGTAVVGGVVVPLVVAPPSGDEPPLRVGWAPPTPSVRPGYALGDWQVLEVVAVAVVACVGVGAAPASIALGPLLTVVGTRVSTHFQTEGQSASEVQLATLAWQDPGKDEVVAHTGAGADPPPTTGAEPEHVPIVVG
jgi:hypothetical protein